MWAPHSPTSSSTRSSAKNIDLRSSLLQDENALENKSFPPDTEMWITRQSRQRRSSRTSSIQSSSVAVRSESISSSSSRKSSVVPEEEERNDRREMTESPRCHIEAWQISSEQQQQQQQQQNSLVQVHDNQTEGEVQGDGRESISGETNNSHLTLTEEYSAIEPDLKTPKVVEKGIALEGPARNDELPVISTSTTTVASQEQPGTTTPGPLERQLLSLLSKVSAIERNQPTIMAEEYQKLEARVAELEAEKQTWQQRHEALFALRDEDVANLVRVRDLLAHERREHEAMRKLRDDDLRNVIELRHKLAQATWSSTQKPEQQQQQQQQQFSSMTTTAGTRMAQPKRLSLSRSSEGSDLWRAAKLAAMEQKVLELERANTDLRAQLERAHAALLASSSEAKTSSRNNNYLSTSANPIPGHCDLDANSSSLGMLFEGAMRHRERFIVRIERLRAENEELRRELSRKEDETAELEHTVEKLRMKIEFGLVQAQ